MTHLWNPCSQMKDYEVFPPLRVKKAKGDYIYLENGKKIIDAISSWWCKSLGHGNDRIKKALNRQMDLFEHVILANTTNTVIEELSERLSTIFPGLDKVFYAGDGSSGVEVAVKMALHANKIQGKKDKTKFVALKNGYHGETALTLSLSDLGIYKSAYQELFPKMSYIQSVPYVSSRQDPLWSNAGSYWTEAEKELNAIKDTLCSIVFEPIVQGAGGMLLYSADFLKKLSVWAKENDVFLIADEILTGFGRTGEIAACKHADIVPDFAIFSKGLTAGWMPMSAVITKSEIYDIFYDDYGKGKDFLHSNTYTGNALAAAVAVETLKIYEDDDIFSKVRQNEKHLVSLINSVKKNTDKLDNIRVLGAVVAADLTPAITTGYSRAGYQVYQKAVDKGALLRPLGNTIYWFPPLNAERETLNKLAEITIDSINDAFPHS